MKTVVRVLMLSMLIIGDIYATKVYNRSLLAPRIIPEEQKVCVGDIVIITAPYTPREVVLNPIFSCCAIAFDEGGAAVYAYHPEIKCITTFDNVTDVVAHITWNSDGTTCAICLSTKNPRVYLFDGTSMLGGIELAIGPCSMMQWRSVPCARTKAPFTETLTCQQVVGKGGLLLHFMQTHRDRVAAPPLTSTSPWSAKMDMLHGFIADPTLNLNELVDFMDLIFPSPEDVLTALSYDDPIRGRVMRQVILLDDVYFLLFLIVRFDSKVLVDVIRHEDLDAIVATGAMRGTTVYSVARDIIAVPAVIAAQWSGAELLRRCTNHLFSKALLYGSVDDLESHKVRFLNWAFSIIAQPIEVEVDWIE